MSDITPAARANGSYADLDDPQQALRHIGSHAHQLRAVTRAADRFNASDTAADCNTAVWLMSSAVSASAELASELDELAHALKEQASEASMRQLVAALRVGAHQLHAAARAADHYLEQDNREDRETGSWLIASAYALAQKLSAAADDGIVPVRSSQGMLNGVKDKTLIEPHDPAFVRRMAAATAPLRGAA
jgi:hypothetical protein